MPPAVPGQRRCHSTLGSRWRSRLSPASAATHPDISHPKPGWREGPSHPQTPNRMAGGSQPAPGWRECPDHTQTGMEGGSRSKPEQAAAEHPEIAGGSPALSPRMPNSSLPCRYRHRDVRCFRGEETPHKRANSDLPPARHPGTGGLTPAVRREPRHTEGSPVPGPRSPPRWRPVPPVAPQRLGPRGSGSGRAPAPPKLQNCFAVALLH